VHEWTDGNEDIKIALHQGEDVPAAHALPGTHLPPAAAEEPDVDPRVVDALLLEQRAEDAADVAVRPRDEDLHRPSGRLCGSRIHGVLPSSTIRLSRVSSLCVS